MSSDDVCVARLTTGAMVPFCHDPDPLYNRLIVPLQLAPRYIAEAVARLAKWQGNKMLINHPDFLLVESAVKKLDPSASLLGALRHCPPPVVRLVDEPKVKRRLTIQVGLDLDDTFYPIETFLPRAKVMAIISMHRNDSRIQSRVSGGH